MVEGTYPSVGEPDVERLLAALRHEKLDRVPNFEILVDARNLSRLLGRQVDFNLWQASPEDCISAVRSVGQDALPCPLHLALDEGTITGHQDMDRLSIPEGATSRDRLAPCLAATRDTRVGVCACISGPLTASFMATGPIPIQSFMELIHDQPDLVDRLMDTVTDYYLDVIGAAGDMPFDLWYIGDDVTGFMSPAMLKELWARRHERIVRAAQETGKPIICHCCGDQTEVLPYFAHWGVDAVHPLQPDMNDIYAVREQYPELALVGNISVQDVLTFGTPEEVARDTEEHIARLGDAGGYIVGSSHSIIDSIPPENYEAMVRTAQTVGVYN